MILYPFSIGLHCLFFPIRQGDKLKLNFQIQRHNKVLFNETFPFDPIKTKGIYSRLIEHKKAGLPRMSATGLL
jgi:hypothetical protein